MCFSAEKSSLQYSLLLARVLKRLPITSEELAKCASEGFARLPTTSEELAKCQ